MRRTALILLALLASSPAAAAEKPAAAKPAAAPATDGRDPAVMAAVLTSLGAKVEIAKAPPAGKVLADVQTPGGGFGLQFIECDAKGAACRAVVFSTAFDRKGVTLTQLNGFNRQAVACRGFSGEDGRPNVAYAALLLPRMTSEDLKQHIGVWQGCLSEFSAFTADPTAYLLSP
jgi:hypothetical protein